MCAMASTRKSFFVAEGMRASIAKRGTHDFPGPKGGRGQFQVWRPRNVARPVNTSAFVVTKSDGRTDRWGSECPLESLKSMPLPFICAGSELIEPPISL